MKDSKLIEQLNNLKSIKPDSEWKNRCRDILYTQISTNRIEVELKQSFWVSFRQGFISRNMLLDLAKPVWAIIIILSVAVSGSFASVYASRDAKPGDSLYIAKIISEKTQQAMTFNETEKTRLGIEFAGNRASEIKQVLNETEGENGKTDQKVEKLSQNFKKEISNVKSRLEKISSANSSGQSVETDDENIQMFSADIGKTEEGMQISEPSSNEQVNVVIENNNDIIQGVATSTTDKIIEEAEKLFEEEDYTGAIDKLIEANVAIEQSIVDDEGEVKGVDEGLSETATSTVDSEE